MAGGKIFISYRRADSQWAAARLYDRLAHEFPDEQIFMDVEEIAPGQDFVRVLADQVGACDVFLALIGPEWLSMQAEDGGRRLEDAKDFVRIEIADALRREDTLTIPVLLDDAEPPLEDDLPDDLKPLARRQFARLSHEGFRGEAPRLVEAIRTALAARAAEAPATAAPRRGAASARAILKGVGGAVALGVACVAGYIYVATPPDPAPTPDLETFKECDLCPEMVAMPAGVFLMGSPPEEENRSSGEGEQMDVALERFAIGRTEVLWTDYRRCVDAGRCEKIYDDGGPKEGMPAAGVSWLDAKAYAAFLNDQVPGEPYRLPSESEWEYAARGGATTAYPWGETFDFDKANMGRVVCCIGHAEGADQWVGVAPVAQFEANGFGLFDMAGNLSEWVEDVYTSDTEYRPTDGAPFFREGDDRWAHRHVVKGGSYTDFPWISRPAARNSNDANWRNGHYGFRVARDMTPRSGFLP